MYFKKPKTSNDFLFFDKTGVDFVRNIWRFKDDIEEETIRKLDNWQECWEKIIQDPILFWYLMVILEVYKDKTGNYELSLSRLVKTSKYVDLIEKFDDDLFNKLSGWDYEIYSGHYPMLLIRMIGLTGAFFAFDIKNISLTKDADSVAQEILKKTIVDARDEMPSDTYLNAIVAMFKELSVLNKSDDNKFFGIHHKKSKRSVKDLAGNKNLQDIYQFSNEEVYFEEIFERLELFGEYIKVSFDFDKENMEKVEVLTLNTVSSFLADLNLLTQKFIKMAKKWERIGNTLYIPFETLFTDFPLAQFLYIFQKNGGCTITSWSLDDNWIVTIFDEAITDVLDENKDKMKKNELSKKKMTFDYEVEILNADDNPLSLGDKNDVFVRMFFDLEKNGAVSIDELAESIDTALESMSKEARHKAEKSLVYDRLPRLNKKILKETGIEEFFFIKNRKVELTDIDLLARSTKNTRKKTKNLEE